MSMFEKAEEEAGRLKAYIYGEAGSGKTITALQFPAPAVVDAEDGTRHYGGDYDFHRINTSDPEKVHEALDELLEDPGDFKTFVIDPMTVIYDEILLAKEERMKMKTGNLHYELQPMDYKSIKTEVKILMNKLLSLDMNCIVTARSKAKYSEEEFMEKIGYQPEGHKSLPYMFDVILQLRIDDDGTRIAKTEKDRTGNLPAEFEFNYDAFLQYIGEDALARDADLKKQQEDLATKTGRSKQITFEGDQVYTAGVEADTLKRLKEATEPFDPESLQTTLKEEYEVDSLLDLSENAAKTLLRAIDEM